jgi:signal transduction histidine kinase
VNIALNFYVYPSLNTITDKALRDYIRDHRIYIYRDDFRIYPYGDRDNDWIKLDSYRGLVKAGYYLSNDQLIGYINITTERNPNLRDKTNREGLLEQGTAYEDLRFLTLSALNFLNVQYRKSIEKAKAKHLKERTSNLFLQTEAVENKMKGLHKYLTQAQDLKGNNLLRELNEEYYRERTAYRKQIEIVEDLAGVGIAVDAASHDLMIVMNRAVEKVDEVQELVNSTDLDQEKLIDKVDALQGQLVFVRSLLTGIQPLFRSSRRRNKELRISNILEKVRRYYEIPLKRIKAEVNIREIGTPLIVTSNEGVLLQLFINLMDNSVYWLRVSEVTKPKIEVLIEGEKGYVIFADNGPGVKKEDIDYIFEPFFTTKGIQGRGLGLYIARQLTDRYEYDLYYLEDENKKILPGANFKIDFMEQEI